jgi:TusA-related sulfurtransferase
MQRYLRVRNGSYLSLSSRRGHEAHSADGGSSCHRPDQIELVARPRARILSAQRSVAGDGDLTSWSDLPITRSMEERVATKGQKTDSEDPVVLGVACTYDAGSTGCGEGLPMEFRRRVHSLEVGEQIEIVLRDPSAKEDLPALARMMGHRIRSMEDRTDGSLVVLVERAR